MTAVPDKGTCQLEQTQVIGWLLVVAHQYRPALGQPAQGAFHHPPPGRVGLPARLVQFLLANTPDLRLVSGVGDGPVAGGIIIPLVQAQVWAPSGRSTTMLSSVGLRSFVSWTLAPATTTLSGPPAPSTRMLFLLPALPRSVGLRPTAPPQNALFPSSSRLTAIPSLRRPTSGILLSGRHRHAPAPHPLPIAGRSGGWCCHLPVPWAEHREFERFAELPALHDVGPLGDADLAVRNFRSVSNARFFCSSAATRPRNSSPRISRRASSRPATANRSITSSASTAPPMTWRTALLMSRCLPWATPPPTSSANRLRIIATTC